MQNLFKKRRRIFLSGWLIVSMLASIGLMDPLEIHADAATPETSVTVGNDAPSFGTAPHEDPISDTTTPTNVGADVTIKATATDANGDGYYLAICKGNGITAGAGGIAPTCTGGAWDITESTTSGVEAVATYTVLGTDTEQSYAWYGFACDNNTGGASCTAMSNSGTGGNSGSPFSVNHLPTFSAVSDEAGNPGATDVTITATTYNDTDTGGAQDTVTMYVCKTAVFTGSACTGGEWCHDTATPTATLDCDLTVPNPQAHGEVNYYPYVVDSHGLQASGGKQGSTESYTVNDVAPAVSGTPTFNGSSAIDLTAEGSTTNITVTGIATDDNGCGDLVEGSTFANAWQTTLVGQTGCDESGEANDNKCYYHATCVYDSVVDTCGASDKTGGYTCTIAFKYHSNPTDAGTPWPTDSWTATFIPGDGQGASASTGNSGTREMNSFLALTLATSYDSIAYGNVAAGAKTDPLLERTRVESSGNVGLDVNLSGTAMTKGSDTIAVGQQKYGLGGTAPAWTAGTALSGTPTLAHLDGCKSGYTQTPAWTRVWWGIDIPAGQAAGAYTGTNTITAVKDGWASGGDWCES